MRLLRVRLANYRGINESEVEFGPEGLTIVEGPNEAGKTSLGESISFLFDYPASSKCGAVKSIKPVNQDVGSEIELEVESCPYLFTYFKRFNKNTETTLTVVKPRPENHTGREAHERAEEILHETIDVDLWNALCIQQGEAVQQADLSKQTSLSTALDSAAGGHQTDPRENSVFEKVLEEFERYYTKGGKEKKELQDNINDCEEAESEVNTLKTQIQNLEKDIDRAAELDQDLIYLKQQEQNIQGDVSEYTKSLDEIFRLETALETAKLRMDSSQKSEQAAKRNLQARLDLVEKISIDGKVHSKLQESSSSSFESARLAESDLEKAQSQAIRAENKRKEAESYLSLCRNDYDYFNDKLHLEQMLERKTRIDRAREDAAEAFELLKSNSVDDDTLNKILMVDRALITAHAKLEMGAPNLLLRGLADFAYSINGNSTNISKDEEVNVSVSNQVTVTIPGSLQMEVTAGSSSSELLEEVEKTKKKLSNACSDAGVSNVDEARRSNNARREAKQSVTREKDIENENLRDLTYEELERRIIELDKNVPSYPDTRLSELELPKDLESAQELLRRAEDVLRKANKGWEEARTKLDLARNVRDELRERHQKNKVELDLKTDELNRTESELARSQKTYSDDYLESEHLESIKLVQKEQENVNSIETDLRSMEPDQIKALVETAKGSLRTVEKKLEAAKKEHTKVHERLRVFGEDGLHEKLHAAQSHYNYVRQENAAMIRRAEAAKLLYLTMNEERDKARRAYVAPLKGKIEKLGRLVFNKTFEVDITEDLSVASRTLDGSNVPFDSLSGGTREQISLISRLACALTVSEEGGAPLILDDALGNTDPERLKLMGAVLAKAGKECQIIILTCVPDRYSNIGEATVVRLG